jgi:16S rRNA processing protein RimM
MNIPVRAQRPSHLLIGQVLRPHGVHGEIRIKVLTDYPERIQQLNTVFLGSDIGAKDLKPYRVESLRAVQQGFALLRLGEVKDRDTAERLRENMIMVAIEDAVPLDSDEFYLYELIGLQVQTESGEPLGTLTEVLETGANDVYVVNSPTYGEVLIPVIDETIVDTDVQSGNLTVRLIEGLLPSPADDASEIVIDRE